MVVSEIRLGNRRQQAVTLELTRAEGAREMAAFVERTGVDEVMVASAIYDHDARKRSLTIAAEAMRGL